jgi:hypothetical protein
MHRFPCLGFHPSAMELQGVLLGTEPRHQLVRDCQVWLEWA